MVLRDQKVYAENDDVNLTELDIDVDLVQQEPSSKLLAKLANMLNFLKAELSKLHSFCKRAIPSARVLIFSFE
jgi:hypothetical protein